MSLNPIGLAIPVFFILIGVEFFVARLKKRDVYRLNDSFTDLACGIGDQVLKVIAGGALLAIYVAVYENAKVIDLADRPAIAWPVALLGVDFFYYWYHRFSHRAHVGWATHVVHHQSEEYNLAVALRQSWFTKFYSWAFYIPLAIVGVPPVIYALSWSINLLYQFWIHTRLIDRLGPLEWVFNTPSHHRVHHGTNAEYLDKNYGGILIIFDRLFGTFEPERAEVVYGTLAPVRSWNPLWVNVQPFVKLAKVSAAMPSLRDKVAAWFMPPGWRGSSGTVDIGAGAARGFDANPRRATQLYIVIHFIPIAVLLTSLLLFSASLSQTHVIVAGALVVFSVVVWGGLFEGRRWAIWGEYARLALLVGLTYALIGGDGRGIAIVATLVAAVASAFTLGLVHVRAKGVVSTS